MPARTSITVPLPDDLLRLLLEISTAFGQSVESLIESALLDYVQRTNKSHSNSSFVLPSDNLGGLMPGVNLDDSAGLLDIMNADEYKDGYTGPYH
jgi:hypothetical protein